MRELAYLEEALAIEEATLRSVNECHEFYLKEGDKEMAGHMKGIMENEKEHLNIIRERLREMKH